MKTDLYTKVILTIIAAALSVIIIKDMTIIPHATASTATQYGNQTLDVRVVNKPDVNIASTNYGLELGVKVVNEPTVVITGPYGRTPEVKVIDR